MTKKMDMKTRVMMLILGMICLGSSIGISRILQLGTDPYTTLQVGVGRILGWEFGATAMLANFSILVFVAFKRRDLIGIGTVLTFFGTGYIAQFFHNIFVPFVNRDSMIQLVGFKAFALVLMGLAIALTIVPNVGPTAYGTLNVTVTDMFKGRVAFRWVRIANDLIFVVIGFALGATVGVGTFLSAFAVGPITNYFMDKLRARYSIASKTEVVVEDTVEKPA